MSNASPAASPAGIGTPPRISSKKPGWRSCSPQNSTGPNRGTCARSSTGRCAAGCRQRPCSVGARQPRCVSVIRAVVHNRRRRGHSVSVGTSLVTSCRQTIRRSTIDLAAARRAIDDARIPIKKSGPDSAHFAFVSMPARHDRRTAGHFRSGRRCVVAGITFFLFGVCYAIATVQ